MPEYAIALIVAALLLNDIVTWFELKTGISWFLGDLGPVAAFSILLLAKRGYGVALLP
ncbi:MAG: hypothetical protein R2839_03555 [Thermomicrobiales bacterium]